MRDFLLLFLFLGWGKEVIVSEIKKSFETVPPCKTYDFLLSLTLSASIHWFSK